MNKDQKEIIMSMRAKKQRKKQPLSDKLARSFNFGACFLPVIYNLSYGRFFLVFCFLFLTSFPRLIESWASHTTYIFFVHVTGVLTVITAVISGFTANKVVYHKRDYYTENEFKEAQSKWIPFVLLAIILHIAFLPIQITRHYNVVQMIKFAEAKDVLKKAVEKGHDIGNLLGVNTIGKQVPGYFAHYLGEGIFDGENTIVMPNGVIYHIIGHVQECGSVRQNTYHEEKTSCATVTIDINGENEPNKTNSYADVKATRKVFKMPPKLGDTFIMYAYNDDLAPKEGSGEQNILVEFERR